MKVVELVLDQQVYGGTPEQLQEQHPSLTCGQIYSALAHDWDHRAAMDADIERRLRRVEQLQQASPPSPLVDRLKREGHISGRSSA